MAEPGANGKTVYTAGGSARWLHPVCPAFPRVPRTLPFIAVICREMLLNIHDLVQTAAHANDVQQCHPVQQ